MYKLSYYSTLEQDKRKKLKECFLFLGNFKYSCCYFPIAMTIELHKLSSPQYQITNFIPLFSTEMNSHWYELVVVHSSSMNLEGLHGILCFF